MLNAALGAGTIVGGAVTFALIGREGLALVAASGALLWGVAVGAHRDHRAAGARPDPRHRRRGRPRAGRRGRSHAAAAVRPRRGADPRVRAAGGSRDGRPGARFGAGVRPLAGLRPARSRSASWPSSCPRSSSCRGLGSRRSIVGPSSRSAPSTCSRATRALRAAPAAAARGRRPTWGLADLPERRGPDPRGRPGRPLLRARLGRGPRGPGWGAHPRAEPTGGRVRRDRAPARRATDGDGHDGLGGRRVRHRSGAVPGGRDRATPMRSRPPSAEAATLAPEIGPC